jgi:hypothetical protein
MYMHPEAMTESLLTVDKPFDQDELNSAMSAIVTQKPYITTIMWRVRAQVAVVAGDPRRVDSSVAPSARGC